MGLDENTAASAPNFTGTPPANNLARLKLPFTPGPLTAEEFALYWEQGFLIKQGLIDSQLLRGARDAIDAEVDAVAEALYKAGKISNLCREEGFEKRLVCIEKQFPSASVLLHKRGILPQGFSDLWASAELTAAVK